MENEKHGMLPFLGMRAPQIETRVHVKSSNTASQLHYQSHADKQPVQTKLIYNYACSCVTFILVLDLFYGECECLKSVFSSLKYPLHLINTIINAFINLMGCWPAVITGYASKAKYYVTRFVIPFKEQDFVNIVKTQLKDRSLKLQTTVQPYLLVEKLAWTSKTKPQIVNQQCVVLNEDMKVHTFDLRRKIWFIRIDHHSSSQ